MQEYGLVSIGSHTGFWLKEELKKFSSKKKKLMSELSWITGVPADIKYFTPKVYDYHENNEEFSYCIEYYYLSTLAELHLYSRHDHLVWERIISSCFSFLNRCLQHTSADFHLDNSEKLYLFGKSQERLEIFKMERDFDLEHEININGVIMPSINDLLKEVNSLITPLGHQYLGVAHGDFCFSNIFYDFKSDTIKLIDPRGILPDGTTSYYGDITYDILKFGHSAVGHYDFIVSGHYDLDRISKYNFRFSLFVDKQFDVVGPIFIKYLIGFDATLAEELYPRLVHLFLSMLPLHSDSEDRQFALLVNAYRIFAEYKNIDLKC